MASISAAARRSGLAALRRLCLLGSRGRVPARQRLAILGPLLSQGRLLARHLALDAVREFPLVTGNATRLLIDGPATHAAMFRAIDEARDHINLETYLFEDDEVGRRLADALVRKRGQGLAVAVLYDSVGSCSTPERFFERLRRAGVRVCEFNPLRPWRGGAWRINHRDHRKILVVDGRVAFTGGLNISSVYSSGSTGARRDAPDLSDGWRDTHLEIRGPAVAQYQRLFLDNWRRQGGEALGRGRWFPPLASEGDRLVRVIASSPDGRLSTIHRTLLCAIAYAERRIWISMAYFVPDRRMVSRLCAAARRGLDVRLILPGFSDIRAALHAGRSHYEALLRAGALIYERRDAMLHAKTAVIDGIWSTVGSSNMDWRSFFLNDEVNAVVIGEAFAREMEAVFVRDLAGASPVTARHWAERPLSDRALQWSARLFERWL